MAASIAGTPRPAELYPFREIRAGSRHAVAVGYASHSDEAVRLYLQETLTFLLLTGEASVALAPPEEKRAA